MQKYTVLLQLFGVILISMQKYTVLLQDVGGGASYVLVVSHLSVTPSAANSSSIRHVRFCEIAVALDGSRL